MRTRRKNALPRLGALFFAVLALIGLAGFASAQTQDTARQRLDSARAALVEIDAAFQNPDLSDGDLQRLRADNDPLAAEVQGVIAELAPKLEASVKRLTELTPKSKDKAPEADAVTGQLAAEQKVHDDLDADLRGATVDPSLWTTASLIGVRIDVPQAMAFALAHGLRLDA